MQATPQNINCQSFCQASPALLGPAAVCAGATVTYSINGLPGSSTISWALSTNVGVTYGSTVDPTFSVSFGGPDGGPGTLYVSITSPCGTGSLDLNKPIYFGAPDEPVIEDDPTLSSPCNYVAAYRIANFDPALTYTARGTMGLGTGGRFRVKASGGTQTKSFTITVTNGSCGTATLSTSAYFEPCTIPARTYVVYPNPAADETTISQDDENDQDLPSQRGAAPAATGSRPGAGGFTVQVLDSYGTLWRTVSTGTGQAQLGTGELPPGLYLLVITEADTGAVVRRHLEVAR